MSETLREVEVLLYEHREDALTCYDHIGYCCICGAHNLLGYRTHLAEILAALTAKARAEALTDAANAWQEGEWTALTSAVRPGGPGSIIGAGQVVADWLRARADREASA